MAFELFQKGSAPVPTVPSVTIQKKGLFSLNEAAQKLLHHPEAIQFLWDADRKIIGLRAAELTDSNAYPARRQASPSGREGRGPVLVAGSMFTKFIELDTSQARRWVPELDGDMLLIDLNTPGQPASSNRSKRTSGE